MLFLLRAAAFAACVLAAAGCSCGSPGPAGDGGLDDGTTDRGNDPTGDADAMDVVREASDPGSEMDQWLQACLDAATWTATCGATAQNVMDLQNACNWGYYPAVLDCMINAHDAGGCVAFYRCFMPADAGVCADMCNFWNNTCLFGGGANCLANCQANPWPQLIVDCATRAIRANDCAAFAACIGPPVPPTFCADFCTFEVTCHIATDPASCLAGCAPVLPPSFTTCFEGAIASGQCRDLLYCFGPGPTPELCTSACSLAWSCDGWTTATRDMCVTTCEAGGYGGMFVSCATGAVNAMDCVAMNACLGMTGLAPPTGYCDSTCTFERDVCMYIAPADYATCVSICNGRMELQSFYDCRQAAVAASDCPGYLNCAM